MWALWAAAIAAEPDQATMMVGHFQDATVILLSVAVGELDSARAQARALAAQPEVPDTVRDAAKGVAGCKKMDCAAPAVAALARTCAECHVAGGKGPHPHDIDAVPGRNARERHIFAALFAWIGLVTPLEGPFALGLTEAIPPVDLESSDDILALSTAFRARAAEALATTSVSERSVAFGRLVEACAACHEKAGVPAAP